MKYGEQLYMNNVVNFASVCTEQQKRMNNSRLSLQIHSTLPRPFSFPEFVFCY